MATTQRHAGGPSIQIQPSLSSTSMLSHQPLAGRGRVPGQCRRWCLACQHQTTRHTPDKKTASSFWQVPCWDWGWAIDISFSFTKTLRFTSERRRSCSMVHWWQKMMLTASISIITLRDAVKDNIPWHPHYVRRTGTASPDNAPWCRMNMIQYRPTWIKHERQRASLLSLRNSEHMWQGW